MVMVSQKIVGLLYVCLFCRLSCHIEELFFNSFFLHYSFKCSDLPLIFVILTLTYVFLFLLKQSSAQMIWPIFYRLIDLI